MHLIRIQHLNILAFSLLIFVGSFSNDEKQAPVILNTVNTCLLNPHIRHRSPYYSYCLFGLRVPPFFPFCLWLGHWACHTSVVSFPSQCCFLGTALPPSPHPYTTPTLLLSQPCVHCYFCTGKRRGSVLFDTPTSWAPKICKRGSKHEK